MSGLPACMYMYHVHAAVCESQKRALDLLKQELQIVVSLLWVLGTEPTSSAESSSSDTCWAAPAPLARFRDDPFHRSFSE